MRFIEEVVVEEFLPTFRALLATDLRERGLTQREVAEVLGVSQSAVSKYAHGAVDVTSELAEDERVRDLVATLGEGLASGELSRVQALAEAEVLIRRLERGDVLSRRHAAQFPPLADYDGEFVIHDPESRLRATERVRASVRRGLRTLENAGGFAPLIPAVGSNLVEALPDAEGVEDVAAVPGRILDVKGRPTIPAEPELGVSVYVASVLLAARAAGSDARAALNVRYAPDLVERLEALGHATAEFDVVGEARYTRPDADEAFAGPDLREAIAEAFDATSDATVPYQTGGFGVEPIIYVLGPDAPSVAAVVRELV